MSTSIFLGYSVLFVLLCLFVKRYGRFLYLTAKVPGPSLWNFVTVHVKELLSDNMVYHVEELSKSYKHKPWGMWTMRGFVVIVSDCESVKAVCTSKSLYNKPEMFYDQLTYYLGRGLLTLNGEEYKRHRKLAGPAFRTSVVDGHLPKIVNLTDEFIEKIREIANGEDIDVRSLVHDHTGVVAVWLFGGGHLPLDRMRPTLKAFEPGLVEIMIASINPIYYYLWHIWQKSTKERVKFVHAQMAERANIYHDEKSRLVPQMSKFIEKKPTCVLDVMMLEYEARGEDETVDVEAMAELGTILAASTDTTAFTLTTCLLTIALHPEVQERICEEIDSIFGGTLRPAKHEDLSRMIYLEMAIKETLRLFPALPIIGRKAEEDVVISGVTVPKGCTVLINILAMHRNPDIYRDPMKYDPSRFLPGLSEERGSHSFIPFSAGYRSCPGQVQAMLTMKTAICYILREFQILPGSGLNSLDDIRPPLSFTFHLPEVFLRFVKRKTS